VSVLDFDHDPEGRPYLVMEYVDGVDLGALTRTGPVPHPVAIFIVRELLAGLGYIHEHRGRGRVRGLVHRDVTPHNVLVSWQGAIKLADFGVAQVIEGAVTAGSKVPVGKVGLYVARAGELPRAGRPVRSVRGRGRALGVARVPAASPRRGGRHPGARRLPGHPAPERVPSG